MIKTFQFRIKDSCKKNKLKHLASKVNFVWNYLNETSQFAWKRDRKWLSEFDFNKLLSNSSKELKIHSQTLQIISHEFTSRRNQSKRCKLNWRTNKKNLGWIPFSRQAIKFENDTFIFQKQKYKFWKSREIEGKIKTGSFSQNSKGQWFVNLHCEVENIILNKKNNSIGIDLGLKDFAVLSNSNKLEIPNIIKLYQKKLSIAHKTKKKKRIRSLYLKITNIRNDFLHKESTKLVRNYDYIFVGNVNINSLSKSFMSKSVYNSCWGRFKDMLEYKTIRFGNSLKIVNEKFSTVTCSVCLERNGPSGLSGLRIREWVCTNCGSIHNRDHNSALNILRIGHDTQ